MNSTSVQYYGLISVLRMLKKPFLNIGAASGALAEYEAFDNHPVTGTKSKLLNSACHALARNERRGCYGISVCARLCREESAVNGYQRSVNITRQITGQDHSNAGHFVRLPAPSKG